MVNDVLLVNKWSVFVRLFVTVLYCGVLFYNERYVHAEDEEALGYESSIFTGRYALLTNLNLAFLTGCLVYGSLCSSIPGSSILHHLDGVLGGASATMSFVVFAIFWILYSIDREMVYPAAVDEIIPVWHNHALHTAIVPASLINYCLIPRRHTPSFLTLQLASSSLALAYAAWIHAIHWATGMWVYPILQILSAGQRVAFIALCCLIVLPFGCAAHSLKVRIDRCACGSGDGDGDGEENEASAGKKVV